MSKREKSMKFYEVMQDKREMYNYVIKKVEWDTSSSEPFGIGDFKGSYDSLPDLFIFGNECYVSAELKEIMEMYTTEAEYRIVIFSNIEESIQKECYLVIAPEIDALGEKTTYLKNGWIDKKVFHRGKIGEYKLFDLEENDPGGFRKKHLYIHLDLVESILRRKLWGMEFKEVMMEEYSGFSR